MINLVFENHSDMTWHIDHNSNTEVTVKFEGKNYVTNTHDYVKIVDIYYNDLHLNELVEHTSMTTDNDEYAYLTGVDYISFNGIWHLKFTDDDVRKILKRKLT